MMVNGNELYDKLSIDEDSMSCFSIDDCLIGTSAAGYRNEDKLNNDGSNGNYWSSTPNSENTQNAYNLNFNSGNQNTNWNNRNNGHSVRPVLELTLATSDASSHFSISKEQLLKDIYRAYKDARKHKQSRMYQLKFEYDLEKNLIELRDELMAKTYKPRPSICFIIHDPKMREVFAANFRDRIVHHLFYNYTHKLFESTFIYDSYSCIKKRGTHFGVKRLKHHILSVSNNYKTPCYILKIDIKGYFMHIDRSVLFKECMRTLSKMENHNKCSMSHTSNIDFRFVHYLLDIIINNNPIDDCIVLGDVSDWNMLPSDKSMMCAKSGCGLPIGNLSSQLFSNVYMNVFDQFVKRQLKCRHYGRYVDDAYIVADSKERLHEIIPQVRNFLKDRLHLSINECKLQIFNAQHGTEFLGAYIKPFRTYVSQSSQRRMIQKINRRDWRDLKYMMSAINSLLGVMSHHKTFAMRRCVFGGSKIINKYGYFNSGWDKYKISIIDRKYLLHEYCLLNELGNNTH